MLKHFAAPLFLLALTAVATGQSTTGPGGWPLIDPPVTAGAAPATGAVAAAPNGKPVGYYRQPAIHAGTIVLVAEGDLWRVPATGGTATRLTSHPGEELTPAISPDGQWVAFTGQYEGPTEVYVMPLAGGLPKRLTFDSARCWISGWSPDGKVIAATERFSTLPNFQLTLIDPASGKRTLVELSQAADGAYARDGRTLFFTRLQFQGSQTKRYKGGTAQTLWRWDGVGAEAVPLSADFAGTSKHAMIGDQPGGRVYFLTDRDGHMNVWSMTAEGKDPKQHTRHKGLDVQGGALHAGKLAYQLGADVWVLDVATDQTASVAIALDTDLDQMRERWVEKPMEYLTSAHLSPDGDRVVMVARGQVFVAPHRQGRLVNVCRDDSIRYREARFMPDGKSLVALSDKSGEIELWKLPANGVGQPEQLTADATVLRWDAVPSPDGKRIAHHDKNQALWIFDVEKKTSTRIDTTADESFEGLTWSSDSQWLAYVAVTDNTYKVVRLYSFETGKVAQVTTDRFSSYSPAWSADGKWLYFLSDRTFRTLQPSPWGNNQPDPYYDETTKVYALALKPGERWPFQPADELNKPAKDKKDDDKKKEEKKDDKADAGKAADAASKPEPAAEAKDDKAEKKDDKKDEKAKEVKKLEIVLEGIAERLFEVPVPSGNYERLTATDKALFFLSAPMAYERKNALVAVEIKNEGAEIKTVLADVNTYEMSADSKKLLVRQKETFAIIDASPTGPGADLGKKQVNLGGWMLSVTPRVQWRQMFIDSWRLMRDYFYDPAMHGVNWRGMLDKYLPLVDRVTTRAELNDLIAQMVGELSALHHFVRGGDIREGTDNVAVAALGGVLERDDAAGGWRITRIYQCEADEPSRVSPLAKPEVAAKVGDVIESIDGTPTLAVLDYATLLRAKAGRQVLIRIKPAKPAAEGSGFADARDAIIVPISQGSENDLRYTDWELSRRLETERLGEGKIGYLHLRAMGGTDMTHWMKGYYPVFNREGLIIDVRHNRGGNIDSWILGKLIRKPWFYWSPRVGNPQVWNMQYAFRGHMVVLCNERTASDGEAFSEGFRRLGLGKVIGTRTWGGEIWLSSSNVLVDKGIASAAETGVWGPEGQWLIEGHGVDPDIVVDNLPHATFKGEDAQLKAAIEYLKQRMKEQPVPPANPPKKPDKSFENK